MIRLMMMGCVLLFAASAAHAQVESQDLDEPGKAAPAERESGAAAQPAQPAQAETPPPQQTRPQQQQPQPKAAEPEQPAPKKAAANRRVAAFWVIVP